LSSMAIVGAALALVAITVGVVVLRQRFAYLSMGWFWYLGMLIPVIGLIQVGEQSHADRYTYLPQIGLYVMITWGLAEVLGRWVRCELILAAGSVACLGILAVCAWRQAQYWKNSEILWRHTLTCTRDNWAVETFLGNYFSDHGKMHEAISRYQRAAELSPDTPAVHFNLGYALYHNSQLSAAQQELEASLHLNPDLTDARVGLGVVLYAQGKIEPAIQQYRQVLAHKPKHAAALSNLGVALESLGRYDEAIAHYRHALEINPALADAERNLARVMKAHPAAPRP